MEKRKIEQNKRRKNDITKLCVRKKKRKKEERKKKKELFPKQC